MLQKKFSYVLEFFGPQSDNNSTEAGSLVLDRRGARDEHRDDQTPKVREAFSVTLLGVLRLERLRLRVGRTSFSGGCLQDAALAGDNVCCPSAETLLARAKLLSVGTLVSNVVIYAVEQKWTATSALIFSAVFLVKPTLGTETRRCCQNRSTSRGVYFEPGL